MTTVRYMDNWTIILDLSIAGFAISSVLLWWTSSRHRVRRISRREALDAADINRLVGALNRAQMLNMRAAFMTACAGALAALRLALDAAGAGS